MSGKALQVSATTRFAVVGTAGHIDHGKTALVRRLTGVDTDRLKEEKERGISIDLGFAPLSLSEGLLVGMVDTIGRAFLPLLFGLFFQPRVASAAGPAIASVSIYLLMAVVLYFKPQGLFPARG